MFDEDKRDMMPHVPPSPIAPPNEDFLKLTVPDASTLEQSNEKTQQEHQKQNEKSPPKKAQTYAAWKKHMLPKVVYPSTEQDNFMNNDMPLNDLYPFRAQMSTAPHMNHIPGTAVNTYPCYNYESDVYYRRGIPSRPTTAPLGAYGAPYQPPVYQQQRRSLDAISAQCNDIYRYASVPLQGNCGTNDVLTLCASTQTDSENTRSGETLSPQTLRQFATKNDVEKILEIVTQMREDQIRLMFICENLVMHQKQQQIENKEPSAQAETRTPKVDATTQSEQKTASLEPKLNQMQAVACDTPKNAQRTTRLETSKGQTAGNRPNSATKVPPARFQTPRMPPAAQSTAYQGHTPPGILRNSALCTPKPTDRTLRMNELALKYLPDEKLHELMNDMQLAGPRNPVMERVLMASKAPTDISNASYKYLKKYRLLPEEENATTSKNMRFFDEETRHSQPNSPYVQRPTDSPIILRRAASEGVDLNDKRNDLFNLEELRNRPKFM